MTTTNIISAKEEADFRRLLANADLHVGKARQFADVLREQLRVLDGANLESIMSSEQQVSELIKLIDVSLEEAIVIETKLTEFDVMLEVVHDSVKLIEEKDSLGHVVKMNRRKLMKDLSEFIEMIESVDDTHINTLKNANFSNATSIEACNQAARMLSAFTTKNTEFSLTIVYQERLNIVNRIIAHFVDKLFSHLTAVFDTMHIKLETQNWGELIMQKHTQRHRSLMIFSNLISWLKSFQPVVYQKLLQRYQINTERLYKNEFQRFFQHLTQRANAEGGKTEQMAIETYIHLLDTTMAEVQTLVENEQKFCVRFFHINAELLHTSSMDTQSIMTGTSNSSDEMLSSSKATEKRLGDQIKVVMAPIFDTLPTHVHNFIVICKAQHSVAVFPIFTALTQRLKAQNNTTSFFSVLYGLILVMAKRLFDEEVKSMENSFMHVKISKKSRVGTLDNVYKFRNFARSVNGVYAVSERRAELDKWLEKFVEAVIFGVNSAAESPNSKYPASVVRFENFHVFRDVLAELKMECLESKRKMVNKMYKENIDRYVQEKMGRPLDKINTFFEQVERAIRSGKKPSEIAYEQQFSRIELKKVISCYPSREVRKGLENLYKQVEKHLCFQSPLLQVVWRNMQDEFLKQVKHYQRLIAQCYSAPRIDLEFTIDEVLQFFSEIAQQH